MSYFAYGSNMDWEQMSERCPTARFVGIAMLRDHRLAFTRCSVTRKCGVADAVQETGRTIWGAVFEVSDADLMRLDAREGYRPSRKQDAYWRRECVVLADGDVKHPLAAAIYFADPEPSPPRPNQEYKDLILAGARHWRLPAEYIAELERIDVAG